jgi:hypothetical protein
MARLTEEERRTALEIAREAEQAADAIGRTGSEYNVHPYGSLDMVDLLARALLDAVEPETPAFLAQKPSTSETGNA